MRNFIILIGLIAAGKVSAAEVTILHTDKQQVNQYQKDGYSFNYLNVDGLQKSIFAINRALPKNQAQASKIAAQMVKRQKKNMESGMRGISLISKWDIKKLPAIVFGNGEAVYYGLDMDAAIYAWEKNQ